MFSRKILVAVALLIVTVGVYALASSTAEAAALNGGYKACKDRKGQWCNGRCIEATDLCLLEPIDPDKDVISGDNPDEFLGVFKAYVNGKVWRWVFAAGVAIALINGTIAGLQIVLSNGDSVKIDAGKTRFISSAIGLIVLLLVGVILEFINPFGFQNK